MLKGPKVIECRLIALFDLARVLDITSKNGTQIVLRVLSILYFCYTGNSRQHLTDS
jgi:hypothetical protein